MLLSGALALAILGTGILVLNGEVPANNGSIRAIGGVILVLLSLSFGVISFVVLIIWQAQSGNRQKRYWVEIATASGREQAMLCLNQESAQEVCNAINQAIIDN